MSAQPTPTSAGGGGGARLQHLDFDDHPFAEVPTSTLADSLEHQYGTGEALDPDIVWEVLNRLLDAEGLSESSQRVGR